MAATESLIDDFIANVVSENPMHASFINASLAKIRQDDRDDLTEYLSFCVADGMSLKRVAECYNTLVIDAQTELVHFMRNKRYRYSTFDEVAGDVYYDPDFMQRYMCGLAVSSFLWPNHNRMHRFFLDGFPRTAGGTYLEVGPGHGYYFMKAAASGQFECLIGVDVSPTSIQMTQNILDYYGIGQRYGERVQLLEADFLGQDVAREDFSVIVMGEVIEHVEEPEKFLDRLRDLCTPNTVVYLTTCANAPAIDHIYLFDSPEHIESMIEAAGLKIEQSLHVPYAGKTLEECAKQRLGVNVAYFLSKTP